MNDKVPHAVSIQMKDFQEEIIFDDEDRAEALRDFLTPYIHPRQVKVKPLQSFVGRFAQESAYKIAQRCLRAAKIDVSQPAYNFG